MEKLLENDFINYYNRRREQPLRKDEINIIHYITDDIRFEIKDRTGKKDENDNDIYAVAKYSNPNKFKMNVINYEEFIKPLPPRVKNVSDIGQNVCDFIVYSANSQYFLLNELTNTESKFVKEYENTKGKREGKLAKAQRQLKHSLDSINNVPSINKYIKQFTIKQCCFFNSYSVVIPDIINAEQAFNQLDEIESDEPSKLFISELESLDFEFCVFSGGQSYLLE
jgi:hypothetical protein